MGDIERDCQTCAGRQYVALLAVSEAIVSHRELRDAVHDLAGRLRHLVRFDRLVLAVHEAAGNSLRLNILDLADPAPPMAGQGPPVDKSPVSVVRQTEVTLTTPTAAEHSHCPGWAEAVRSPEIQSTCELPLTTNKRRLGTLVFASKGPSVYGESETCFLRHVADQVAVAVENALAFQELGELQENSPAAATSTGPCWRSRKRSSSHRDLPALFHELAGRLIRWCASITSSLVLHERGDQHHAPARPGGREALPPAVVIVLPPEDDPAGLVWQTQQPLITSSVAELSAGRGCWNECSRTGSRATAGCR